MANQSPDEAVTLTRAELETLATMVAEKVVRRVLELQSDINMELFDSELTIDQAKDLAERRGVGTGSFLAWAQRCNLAINNGKVSRRALRTAVEAWRAGRF